MGHGFLKLNFSWLHSFHMINTHHPWSKVCMANRHLIITKHQKNCPSIPTYTTTNTENIHTQIHAYTHCTCINVHECTGNHACIKAGGNMHFLHRHFTSNSSNQYFEPLSDRRNIYSRIDSVRNRQHTSSESLVRTSLGENSKYCWNPWWRICSERSIYLIPNGTATRRCGC